MDFKKVLKPLYIIYFIIGILTCFSLWFYFSLPDVNYLKNENPNTTALIEYRKMQAESDTKKLRIRQKWVGFREIPDLFKKAVRITEDAAFYKHEGIDWTELKESIAKNLEEGEYARGASTITQQLAKNLFLSTEKSIFRKVREFYITKRLESELNKSRIFHLYLNVIEFGPGIFGVEAASEYYFNKSVKNLTLSEMVRLTAIIPRPLSIRANGDSKWLKWKARWILDKMKLYKYITHDQHNITIQEFK